MSDQRTERPQLDPRKVGAPVRCALCGATKKPVGRSGPLDASYCEPLLGGHGCEDYWQQPYPGSLWPGESEAEFGYPVGEAGTVIRGEA